jgi:hypothetical protein
MHKHVVDLAGRDSNAMTISPELDRFHLNLKRKRVQTVILVAKRHRSKVLHRICQKKSHSAVKVMTLILSLIQIFQKLLYYSVVRAGIDSTEDLQITEAVSKIDDPSEPQDPLI